MVTAAVPPQTSVYVSGFCSIKACEGTRPKGVLTGTPMKTCTMISVCSCDCHKTITAMMEMAQMERVPQVNPEYKAPERTYWMPEDEPNYTPDAASEFTATGDLSPEVIERKVGTTASGRTERGGLEFLVQRECLAWFLDQHPPICSPAYLSREIARIEGIKEPSQGAIGAVFNRWELNGYAEIGRKPTRFVQLTELGKANGLDWCKAQAKKRG